MKWIILLMFYSAVVYGSANSTEYEEEEFKAPAEVCHEPVQLYYSSPNISNRLVIVSTWRISNERNFALFFSFVFDRETNTPDRPIYALQGHNYDQARSNHEAAEEWASIHVRAMTPLALTPVNMAADELIILPPPPRLVRQRRYRTEQSLDLTFELTHRSLGSSTTTSAGSSGFSTPR
jgi:hypothetical protein